MAEIYLRALELSDIDKTHKWHNDPELYKTLGGVFRYTSKYAEEQWLKEMATFKPNEINLAVCLKQNNEHVGNAYLRNIDWINRHGEIHIFIGNTDRRLKGLGTAAIKLFQEYCFDELGLERLYAFAIADNHASIKLSQNCGWKMEGTLRNHIFKNGKFKDTVILGICRGDEVRSI